MRCEQGMPELLPCPFCGGAAYVHELIDHYPASADGPAGSYSAWFHIGCQSCCIEVGDEYQSTAVFAWNRREHAASLQQADGWRAIADELPEFGVPVWLHEDGHIFVGERSDDSDGWLWANCYDSFGYDKNANRWNSYSAEVDDDYQPSHWMPLPNPPSPSPKGKDRNNTDGVRACVPGQVQEGGN